MSDLFWLAEARMARLQFLCPKSHGRPRIGDRRVPSGMIFVDRNGLRWRDAPRERGSAKTLYNRWKGGRQGRLLPDHGRAGRPEHRSDEDHD